MKLFVFSVATLSVLVTSHAEIIAESQTTYIEKYAKQKKIVAPENALINTDEEPDLTEGFIDLYNGKNLENWVVYGGNMIFEAHPDKIVGKVVPGESSAYLTTRRDDLSDFILTAEFFWAENSNTGIMVRSQLRDGQNGPVIFGPQVEMEGFQDRGWSGGIYGQSAGGWFYPLWLEAHEEARNALKENEWNRVTVACKGSNFKTWVNGIPAAHWESDDYTAGSVGLQVHSGKNGEVHFRNVRIKEFNPH